MNEYQMRFLAEDRQRELRAEADRARLARQAVKHASIMPTGPAPRRRRPLLADLISRVFALGDQRA